MQPAAYNKVRTMIHSPSSRRLAEEMLKKWYANIDISLDRDRRAVALVVRVIPGPRIEGFGSGFFYKKNGVPFFITAKHVLDDAITSNHRGERTVLITRGCKEFIDILKYEFFVQPEFDIAIAPLSTATSTAYSHIEFLTPSNLGSPLEPGLFAFTGFPASKNKTYTNQQIKPHQRVIMFDRSNSDPLKATSYFLEFPINPREFHKSDLTLTNMEFPSGLSGMSGGPVFKIGGTIDSPQLKICGVGIAWSDRRALKILRFDLADIWLSQYHNW